MKLLNTTTVFTGVDLYGGGTTPAAIDISTTIGNHLPLASSVRLVGGAVITATAGATITVRLYMGISSTKTSKIFEGTAVTESGVGVFYISIPEIPIIVTSSVNDLHLTIQSDNASDTSCSGEILLYDASKSLDIATVNEAAPVSAADVADVILKTPANLLATDANGAASVNVGDTNVSGTLGNWLKKLMGKR